MNGPARAVPCACLLPPPSHMPNDCHWPRGLRQREGTYKSEGRLIVFDERLTSVSILARLGASEGRSDAIHISMIG